MGNKAECLRGRKKRGGFCRPPRQLYPQEERGIQRRNYSGFAGGWQCAFPHELAPAETKKQGSLPLCMRDFPVYVISFGLPQVVNDLTTFATAFEHTLPCSRV